MHTKKPKPLPPKPAVEDDGRDIAAAFWRELIALRRHLHHAAAIGPEQSSCIEGAELAVAEALDCLREFIVLRDAMPPD